MKLRSLSLVTLFAATVFGAGAQAHDPMLHDSPSPAPKPEPATCAQLEDTARYAVDETDPDTRALKARCDAEAAADKADSDAEEDAG